MFIRSPFNYTGGKYPLMPQLVEHFPSGQIRNYIEFFAGGYNVGINIFARSYILNEKDKYVAGFYNYLRDHYRTIDKTIEAIVDKWNLTNSDADAFYTFRGHVNKIIHSNPCLPELPVLIFTLSCFAFNSMIRYNNDGEFNNTFGKRRYNKNIAARLYEFGKELNAQQLSIYSDDFEQVLTDDQINELNDKDFVYMDPPYLITEANYCLNNSWTEEDDKRLYTFIDKLNAKGVRFALSNALSHKGRVNEVLKNWLDKNNYNVYHLDKNYDKVQLLGGESNTDEVLITNY